MRLQQPDRQQGFTLLEVLVSTSIFLLILMGIYNVFDTSRATYASGLKKADVQQSARFAMEEMAKRVRLTGYFWENFFAVPLPSPLLQDSIRIATNNTLVVYGDLDNSGASNIFLFCFDAASSSIIRKKSPAADINTVASYTCAADAGAEHGVGDIILSQNVSTLQFTYFDVNNAAIGATTGTYQLDGQAAGAVPDFGAHPPVLRRTVRTIVITLVAKEDVPQQASQQYTLTSTIRLRNLN
jgi:prepilin-type N-terminal cleavage/methylation domain-containing protein